VASWFVAKRKAQPSTKSKRLRFDRFVARYYPAVYSFASRLTDDPHDAVVLTRTAFKRAQEQLGKCRDEPALATILVLAVIRAGLTGARA
jgi:hypothetical protein